MEIYAEKSAKVTEYAIKNDYSLIENLNLIKMENINKQLVELPNGIYDTLWSAHQMEILIPNDKSVYVETIIGVKGINCKQKVKIKDKLLSAISNI